MPAGSSEHLAILRVQHAVFQPGPEIGRRDILRVGVVEIIQHQPQVTRFVDGGNGTARPAPESGRELPAAEIGCVEALPPLHAAGNDVLELAGVVAGGGFVRHVKMRFDHIVDILQKQGGALYDLLRRGKLQRLPAPLRGLAYIAPRDLAGDLVAADADEADGVEYINFIDVPT